MTSTIINKLRLATGIVGGVGNTWKTVRLPHHYQEMVVVATPSYNDAKSGAVVRIRNANLKSKTFEVRVENPRGDDTADYYVNYVAMEAGVFENANGGIKIEAQRIASSFVDQQGSWQGQPLTTESTFADPVVLGQVMTADDAWSVFWARHVTDGTVNIGRHIGADPRNVANTVAETVGVIVIEAGKGEINGIQFMAGHTPEEVVGRQSDSYTQPLGMLGLTAVASPASMNGGDGYWPVLWGEKRYEAFLSRSLALTADEDQITDDEQGHIAEKVAYLALNGEKDGARFLAQAGFGGYFSDIRNVSRDGYGAWIDVQKRRAVSLTRPYMEQLMSIQYEYHDNNHYTTEEKAEIRAKYPFGFSFPNQSAGNSINFSTIWMRNIVHKNDPLRQRVAWALSQIMVVSYNHSKLRTVGRSIADYYDTLAEHAFGNFRDLLLAVSLHPAMAYYLSSLGNQKASADGSRQPDENYAREVMQLFSIGLWELNNDGTRKLDAAGEPIPTYNNDDITELARVFTGLWYEGRNFGIGGFAITQGGFRRIPNSDPKTYEMLPLPGLVMDKNYHDDEPKTLFQGKSWEITISNGDDGMADIEDAIDALFNHPNTPIFIARRLIQFLVTSNPTTNYIKRITSVFRNNGEGVRGDLHAVVRGILLDPEARNYRPGDHRYGKLIEPMIRVTRAVKAFRAGRDLEADDVSDPANPVFNDLVFYRGDAQASQFGQWPLFSNSVFNFFEPDYQHGGVLVDGDGNNLFSPEFQVLNPVTATAVPNELARMIDNKLQRTRAAVTPDFKFDFSGEINIAHNIDQLLNRLDTLLTEGQMSDGTRTAIKQKVERIGLNKTADTLTDVERWNRVRVAVWGVLISPECAIMR